MLCARRWIAFWKSSSCQKRSDFIAKTCNNYYNNCGMSSLNVNLPDDLRHFAEERAAEMGFPNTSAYVESLLVRESERRQAKLKLESELIRGLDSGPPIEAGE